MKEKVSAEILQVVVNAALKLTKITIDVSYTHPEIITIEKAEDIEELFKKHFTQNLELLSACVILEEE